jgi:hypothetical protein
VDGSDRSTDGVLGDARERKGWVERKRRKIIENMAGIFGNA